MVVGLLATLKVGGAYVPLDPDYPRERLNHMASDSAIELLLTQSHIKDRIPQIEGRHVLELDALDLSNWPPSATLEGSGVKNSMTSLIPASSSARRKPSRRFMVRGSSWGASMAGRL